MIPTCETYPFGFFSVVEVFNYPPSEVFGCLCENMSNWVASFLDDLTSSSIKMFCLSLTALFLIISLSSSEKRT